jgi:peptidoglycan/LPS O-acetylase OafA/YrhL
MPDFIAPIQKLGILGVRIFFCISGFVICRGMIAEFRNSGGVSMRGFYIRRAYRILPILVAYFLCVALMNNIGIFNIRLSEFLKAGAFLCNISQIGPECKWALGHTWSLAYEEQFYLVFPLLFIFLRLSENRSALLKLILVLIPIYIFALKLHIDIVWVYIGEAIYLLAGCVCALYWDKLERGFQKLSCLVWLAICLLMVLLSIFSMPTILKTVFPLGFAILICIAVFGTPTRITSIRAIFTNPVLAYWGRISYGVYLWQELATADYGFVSPLTVISLVVITFVFAHYSYQFFELPLIRRGHRLSSQHVGSSITPTQI